ncbi:YicC family protein [Oscillospiraceae bacterium OttesenSCG-928-G22]|nr:YicC family protein [Oscillospiraceae bacterium OttesenSCG-928-G22]
MNMKSMTGYGRAQGTFGSTALTVEVRSVNHRYLDCSVRIPRVYVFLEEPIKALVTKAVPRGKVDVFVTIESEAGEELSIRYSEPVLRAYVTSLTSMKETFQIPGDIDLMQLARFPEVFTVKREEEDPEELKKRLLALLGEALAEHGAMCAREGENLKRDLLDRAETIECALPRMRARSKETVAEYREKLRARMAEVLADAGIDENRILSEAAVYADRVAVDEEFVRLESHIAQLRQMLASGGAIGRKLDFLMQEFNREINTIGSKANDLDIARDVIEIKAEIEKMREQVQNIG